MKRERKILLTVVILAVAFDMAGVAKSAPMGTAFTYQGRLIDGNNVADGLYDFQFKLFDDPNADTQKGNTVYLDEVDVIDGYFTVELDLVNSIRMKCI